MANLVARTVPFASAAIAINHINVRDFIFVLLCFCFGDSALGDNGVPGVLRRKRKATLATGTRRYCWSLKLD